MASLMTVAQREPPQINKEDHYFETSYGIEVESLLQTPEGQRTLLAGMGGLGVDIDKQNFRLSYKEFNQLARRDYVPAMYEDNNDQDARIMSEEFSLELPIPTFWLLGSVELVDFRVVDQPLTRGTSTNQQPFLTISHFDDSETEQDWHDISNDLPLPLTHGKKHRFCLNCAVPPSYRGAIEKWVIFVLSGQLVTPSPLQKITSTIAFGCKLSATIVDDATPFLTLRTESKPFVPSYMRAYFDRPAMLLNLPSNNKGGLLHSVIDKLESALAAVEGTPVVQAVRLHLQRMHKQALASVTRGDFTAMTSLLDSQVGVLASAAADTADTANTTAATPHGSSSDRMRRLFVHLCLEEEAMRADIQEWDQVAETLKVGPAPANNQPRVHFDNVDKGVVMLPNGMPLTGMGYYVTVSVKGSSESRPEIKIGDKVLMKISSGSVAELTFKYNCFLQRIRESRYVEFLTSMYGGGQTIDASYFHDFVLEGTVTRYVLKTETVTLLLVLPLAGRYTHVPVLRHLFSNSLDEKMQVGARNPKNLEKCIESDEILWQRVLTEIKWHLRFTFSNSGLKFARQACLLAADSSSSSSSQQQYMHPPTLRAAHLNQQMGAEAPEAVRCLASRRAHQLRGLNEDQVRAVRSIIFLGMPACRARIIEADEESGEGKHAWLGGSSGSKLPPFIVYGPPGTGKTRTVVQAIETLVAEYKDGVVKPVAASASNGNGNTELLSILVTAPSDAAADVVALRLVESLVRSSIHNKKEKENAPVRIVRLNWYQRTEDSVPIALRAFCIEDKEAQGGTTFTFPPSLQALLDPDDVGGAVVVVATCGASGVIPYLDLVDANTNGATSAAATVTTAIDGDRGIFDYVFVDEASQATEPETLVPLQQCKRRGVCVLAGDPHQLGPAVRSPFFRLDGAATSLLSRLLQHPTYSYFDHPGAIEARANSMPSSNYGYNGGSSQQDNRSYLLLGVFLRSNYRSHADLLSLPSRLFYDNQLKECASREETAQLIGRWQCPEQRISNHDEEEKGKEGALKTACVFVGIPGSHAHDTGSPSFYNVSEAEAVTKLVRSLLDTSINAATGTGTGAAGIEQSQRDDVTSSTSTGVRLTTKDIGVICAYRAQVLLVRQYLRKAQLGLVNVGSVEDFQGQECVVCVVSTVLTSRHPLQAHTQGQTHTGLGLLGDARRFNVAVTRARALCLVVGHPAVLAQDTHWRAYLESCYEAGGYYGTPCAMLGKRTSSDNNHHLSTISLLEHVDSSDNSDEDQRLLGGRVSQAVSMGQGNEGECAGITISLGGDTEWRSLL
jgi:putative helicase MOV10L1/helicase MOV-10